MNKILRVLLILYLYFFMERGLIMRGTKKSYLSMTENLTIVYNSYSLDNDEIKEVVDNIIEYRSKKDLPITRSAESYEREIKAHNKLYKLGLFRKHTKDTDLEEHIEPYKEILYKVIVLFCH